MMNRSFLLIFFWMAAGVGAIYHFYKNKESHQANPLLTQNTQVKDANSSPSIDETRQSTRSPALATQEATQISKADQKIFMDLIRTALEANMAQLPRDVFPRLGLRVIGGSIDSVSLRLQFKLDDVPIENADILLVKNAKGEWLFEGGKIPVFSESPAEFPRSYSDEALELVKKEFEKEEGTLLSIKESEKSWFRNLEQELIPCLNVEIRYQSPKGIQLDQLCVNAESGSIEKKYSKLRKL